VVPFQPLVDQINCTSSTLCAYLAFASPNPFSGLTPHALYYTILGDYVADLLVEDCILVELKAVKALDEIHSAQCLNYLKATGLRLCLLINFGNRRVEIKRLAL
jgi:hypothetical protein